MIDIPNDDRKPNNKKIIKYIICLFLVIISFGCIFGMYNLAYKGTRMGEELVEALYHYIPSEIKAQDSRLKELLSDEMYNKYTIGSDQRQMRMYLKFKNETCVPNIIYQGDNYVIYNLQSNNIGSDRIFQIHYKFKSGVITDINESEIFFLPPSGSDFFK